MVIALATAILFANLGLWQLRRLDERRELNATITDRSGAAPVQLGTALATHGTDPDALAYRHVVVEGEYDPASEVTVIGTTLNGRSGHDVVTPLDTDGATIAVRRGWVPIDSEGPPVAGAEPPLGPVELVGLLLESETAGSLGTPCPDGIYRRVGRVDLDALAGQWSDLLPVYILLETQNPAGGDLPVPRPPPEPAEGSHLSYAIQWFIFTAIVLIGFPALVYRSGRPYPAGR
jgi:surfeit locus 1 family protein